MWKRHSRPSARTVPLYHIPDLRVAGGLRQARKHSLCPTAVRPAHECTPLSDICVLDHLVPTSTAAVLHLQSTPQPPGDTGAPCSNSVHAVDMHTYKRQPHGWRTNNGWQGRCQLVSPHIAALTECPAERSAALSPASFHWRVVREGGAREWCARVVRAPLREKRTKAAAPAPRSQWHHADGDARDDAPSLARVKVVTPAGQRALAARTEDSQVPPARSHVPPIPSVLAPEPLDRSLACCMPMTQAAAPLVRDAHPRATKPGTCTSPHGTRGVGRRRVARTPVGVWSGRTSALASS